MPTAAKQAAPPKPPTEQEGVEFVDEDDLAPVEGGVEGTGRELTGAEEEDYHQVVAGARNYSNAPQFQGDEVAIPRLRLAQGLTQEVTQGSARPGDWLVGGQEAQKTVVVIPLMFARARELRSLQDNKVILCASSDAVTGVGDPGGNCAVCPMNQWGPPKPGSNKNTPPACTKVFSYVVYSVTHGQIVALEFKRTGQSVAKFLNSMIQLNGLGKFGISLSSTTTQNAQGTFFVPQAVLAKVGPEELRAATNAMSGSSAWEEGEDAEDPDIEWPPTGDGTDVGRAAELPASAS